MENNQNHLQFIIHRGSQQIGGNCVELATQNSRILIDCGLPLDFEDQPKETQEKIIEDAKEWTRDCDAIFLSHYHGDHYGLLYNASKGTKVYTSKETANLMKVSGLLGNDLTKHLDNQTIDGTIMVKDFRVTAFPVDHSAFGACAFLFEVEGKTILYSGDIRLHGKKGILYKRLPRHVDYLFLEGTNIGRAPKQQTETDMENEFVSQFLSNNDSLHLVWCSSQNIDRIVALYRACKRANRILCVDLYAAYVLELVHASNEKIPSIKTHSNLMVYFPHRLTSLLIDKDEKLVYALRQGATKLVKGDLSANPSKYVVLFRPKLLGDLGRYVNNTKVCLTTSIWKQYWEQDKPEIKRMKAWLAAKPKLRKKLKDIHTSGHADVKSLQQIVEHIEPKTIVPIHTEHSMSFSTLFPSVNVMDVSDGVRYPV